MEIKRKHTLFAAFLCTVFFGGFLFFSELNAASDTTSVGVRVESLSSLKISNVNAKNITTSSAEITFTTNAPATCKVNYGTDENYDDGSEGESSDRKSHTIKLTGLDQGERYYYEVVCKSRAVTVKADGFDFDTKFKKPDFDFNVIQMGKSSKVDFTGKTGRSDWKVHLIVVGPMNFTRVIDVGTDFNWHYMTGYLNPGVYFAKIYEENEHGMTSEYSNIKSFTIVYVPDEEITPPVPPVPPTQPPTEPTLPPTPVELPVKPDQPDDRDEPEIKPNLLNTLATTLFPDGFFSPETAKAIQEALENVQEFVQLNEKPLAIASTIGAVASTLPFLLQFSNLGEFFMFFRTAAGAFLGIFMGRGKREWGIVYNGESGKPVPMAIVSILNEAGKKAESKFTDKLGGYGFLVPPGKYTLFVEKKGYEFKPGEKYLRTAYSNLYEGETITINDYDIINKDIPMAPLYKVVEETSRWHFWLDYLLSALFYGGFAFSIFTVITNPTLLNFLVCGLYVLFGFMKNYAMGSEQWGKVVDADGFGKPFTYIKVYDKASGKLTARSVSDEKGRYYLILEKGIYRVEAQSNTGDLWKGDITVKKRSAIKKRIQLRRKGRKK